MSRGRARMRVSPAVLALAVLVAALPTTASTSTLIPPDDASLLAASRVDEALERWDLDAAARRLEVLREELRDSAAVEYAEGRLAFFRGDYEKAVAHLRDAVAAGGAPGYFFTALAIAKATVDATDDLDVIRSADRRLLLRASSRDAVLIPYVEASMPAVIEAIETRLGYAPSRPLRIEFLPEVERLSAMTGLTVKAIHTSGTIAVCKFDRLMVTTPRALLMGYPWIDTVAHEYVHYAINHLSGGNVPIWLHEGLAKYLERTWRGATALEGALTPTMEHLLAKALKRGKLIPFSKMHPSMAMLPSQEEAALAFAEVFTVVDHLVELAGWEGVRSMLSVIRSGADAEEAIAEVTGMPFERFISGWRKGLRKRKLRMRRGMVPRRLSFRGSGDPAVEEKPVLGEIKTDKARKYLRLGELLSAEGHMVAAVVELEKAHRADKRRSPVIALKLGRAYLSLDQHERAVEVVSPLLDSHPSMVGVHTVLGTAYHRFGEELKAEEHLLESVRINPFDPAVHVRLAEVYEALGRRAEADRERNALALLGSR